MTDSRRLLEKLQARVAAGDPAAARELRDRPKFRDASNVPGLVRLAGLEDSVLFNTL